MTQDYYNYDEIKRKLRKLKKIEMKIREKNIEFQKDSKKAFSQFENTELVWNKFFNLKDEITKNVKYSIKELSLMTRDEFKDVITEYFYSVYFYCYKESGLTDNLLIDDEILTQLGLPIYADQAEIKRRFRELAKIYHPDNGGDSAKFLEIMEQYKNLKS